MELNLKLNDLLRYDDIMIQCHDDPDADAIASGFALLEFLKSRGKSPRFVYGGKRPISKPDLKLLCDACKIPVKYLKEQGDDIPELLVMVDCHPGQSNGTPMKHETLVVIDHHAFSGQEREILTEDQKMQLAGSHPSLPPWAVRAPMGSCSTLLWHLLRDAGDTDLPLTVATALSFGLYIDTAYYRRLERSEDLTMKVNLRYDPCLFDQLDSARLSLDGLIICGRAMATPHYNIENHFAVAEALDCSDTNLLGVISDRLIGVQDVELCVAYCVVYSDCEEPGCKEPHHVQISVRSQNPDMPADNLAEELARGLGDGGGQSEKVAGGKLLWERLKKVCGDTRWDGISGAAGRFIYAKVLTFCEERIRQKTNQSPAAEAASRQQLPTMPDERRTAREELTARAEAGDAAAQYELGQRYAWGEGAPRDWEQAAYWLTLAAENGHVLAQYSLAGCYASGEGDVQDWEQAVCWYTRAAEQGNADAQHSLGVCYAYGRGVGRDLDQAVQWYTRAAEQGHDVAQKDLGVCYARGRGVPQDWEQAAYWYAKSAENGNSRAQYNLAQRYYRGEGVAQSYEEAAEWFRKAAEQGYSWAQYRIGACLAAGEGVPQDWAQAVRWYAEAARQGIKEARSALLECYLEGRPGVPRDPEKAQYWEAALGDI